MIIRIDEYSEIPIYQQLRDQIVTGISNGQLERGERLPAVRALADQIGINSMTVNKAYQLLKQEGYIQIDRRSGARVSDHFEETKCLSEKSLRALRQIASEAKISGMELPEFLSECEKVFQEVVSSFL